MTPAEFTQKWKHSPIVKFRLPAQASEGLSCCSASVLREYGLPQTAEPWLSFMEFVPTDRLTPLDAQGLFPIGCLANGSCICIEKQSDRLVIFDPNEPDELWALNSSLEALYESMVIFASFIEEVNRRNPNYNSNFKIPDGMLSELKEKLTACDSEAMAAKGYWYCEIGVLDDSSVM